MGDLKNIELYEFFNLGAGSRRKPEIDVIYAKEKSLVIETNDPVVYLNILPNIGLIETPENPHVSMVILFREGVSICGFENGDEILDSKNSEIISGNIFDYLNGINIHI